MRDSQVRYYGLYRGIVKDNRDPQSIRRLKVSVPQVTQGMTTDWIWPILPTERPPAIGAGVWVFYIGGDPDYPVWIGTYGQTITSPFSYGAWKSLVTHTAAINTPTAITLEETDFSSGVTLKNGSQLYVDQTATYNVQISLQVYNTGGGGTGSSFVVWFRKNGVDIPASSSLYNIGSNQYAVPALNIMLPMKKNDYVQVMWATDNANIEIDAASTIAGAPLSPAAIVTVNQVS